MIHVVLLLAALTTATRAQLFTCNDTVTVCLTGVETCCCQQPLTVLCQCCQPSEFCFNGTCAAPSPTPSATPTPSASAPPPAGCTQVDGSTLSCSGSLDNTVVTVPVNITTISGNLLMTNTTTLRITDAVSVNGSVVIAGTVQAVLTAPPNSSFVVLVTGSGSVTADPGTVVELSGPGVPQPKRNCEEIQQTSEVRGGSQFGVLLETDSSACGHGSGGQPAGWWAYQILLPVLLVGCCCLTVCCVGLVVMVFWNRLRILTWKRERDTCDDPISAAR